MNIDGEWNPQNIPVVTFVLKKVPNPSIIFKYGPSVCDPIWFICKGCEIKRPIRLAWQEQNSFPGADQEWKKVLCHDKIVRAGYVKYMDWEVKFTDDAQVFKNPYVCRKEQDFLNDNVQVIRLHVLGFAWDCGF